MKVQLSPSAAKVQEALVQAGLNAAVIEMPASTRSAAEAAAAVGCRVGQIAKSLVFRAGEQAVLVITSGANRVNEPAASARIGAKLSRADADFVRRQTGFAIGGVPPLAHARPCPVFIDEDLFQYEEIWAAAGTPQAVFKSTPADLQRVTSGRVIKVT